MGGGVWLRSVRSGIAGKGAERVCGDCARDKRAGRRGLPQNEFWGSARRRSVASDAPQGSACSGRSGRRLRDIGTDGAGAFTATSRLHGGDQCSWRSLLAVNQPLVPIGPARTRQSRTFMATAQTPSGSLMLDCRSVLKRAFRAPRVGSIAFRRTRPAGTAVAGYTTRIVYACCRTTAAAVHPLTGVSGAVLLRSESFVGRNDGATVRAPRACRVRASSWDA